MKKGRKGISIYLTNRLSYTLIVVFIIAIVSVGIYAVAGPVPSPGHSFSEIQACSNGEILKVSAEGAWTCGSETDGQTLSVEGQQLSISGGNSVVLPGANLPACSNGQILKYNNGWVCGTDTDTNSYCSVSTSCNSGCESLRVTISCPGSSASFYAGGGACGYCN